MKEKLLKSRFLKLVSGMAGNQGDNILGDIWDIAKPIVENISGMDLNDDEVVTHMRSEILRIAEDKAIEWGHCITNELVKAAKDDILRRMFAAAKIAEWVSKIWVLSKIPGSSWIINLAIEMVICGIRRNLLSVNEKCHEKIRARVEEFDNAIATLIRDLTKNTGAYICSEHFWGTDEFKLLVWDSAKSEDKPFLFRGSLETLVSILKNQESYVGYVKNWERKIKSVIELERT